MPRSGLAALAFLLAAQPAYPANPIPPHVIGVWATEGSLFRGPILFEGQAVYLGADGEGAIVGGPPPIGVRIVATFDAATNTIDFDSYDGARRGPHGAFVYDPKENVLDTGAPDHRLMRRRAETFTDETKKALGL